MSKVKLIDNPIEWQKMIDNAPMSINNHGSLRFWLTVQEMLGSPIIRSSAPELSELVMQLSDDVWLNLKADGHWIDYRFLSQAEVEKKYAWAFECRYCDGTGVDDGLDCDECSGTGKKKEGE